MSNYNSTLQSNNTDLQTILNTINELPEVTTGGGSGGSVETCTVVLDADEKGFTTKSRIITDYCFSVYVGGVVSVISALNTSIYEPTTIANVICGSVAFISTDGASDNWSTNGASLLYSADYSADNVFKITANGGETATITYN